MPLPRYFEKISHKHYCHFFDQSAFFDTTDRKRLYSPFKLGAENYDIAQLYKFYKTLKTEKIKKLEDYRDWETREKPDFIKAAENALYEIKKNNLTTKEKF